MALLTPRELQAKTRALRGMTSSAVRELMRQASEAEADLTATINLDPRKPALAARRKH